MKKKKKKPIFDKVGLIFRNPIRVDILKQLSESPQRPKKIADDFEEGNGDGGSTLGDGDGPRLCHAHEALTLIFDDRFLHPPLAGNVLDTAATNPVGAEGGDL